MVATTIVLGAHLTNSQNSSGRSLLSNCTQCSCLRRGNDANGSRKEKSRPRWQGMEVGSAAVVGR